MQPAPLGTFDFGLPPGCAGDPAPLHEQLLRVSRQPGGLLGPCRAIEKWEVAQSFKLERATKPIGPGFLDQAPTLDPPHPPRRRP